MARQLTTQNIFQLIVNGVTGNMEIVLQRVEMAWEKNTGLKSRKSCMEEPRVKVMQECQSRASKDFAQVNWRQKHKIIIFSNFWLETKKNAIDNKCGTFF